MYSLRICCLILHHTVNVRRLMILFALGPRYSLADETVAEILKVSLNEV